MSTSFYTLPGRAPVGASRGERLAQWAIRHRAQIGVGLGVVFLGGLFSILIVTRRNALMESASERLSTARFQAASGKTQEALGTVNEIIAAHGTNDMAMQAFVLKGEFLFMDRKFAEAAENYEEGYRRAANPAYRALMLSGLAASAAELGQLDKAAERLEGFVQEFPEHYLVPRTYMELARARIARQEWEKAREALERLLTLYPKSPWAREAELLLEEVRPHLPPEPLAEASTASPAPVEE